MILKLLPVLWAFFIGTSLLTSIAYWTLWATSWYWTLLSILGVLSGILAAKILLLTGLKHRPIIGVAMGLLLGQWWFVVTLITQIFWSIGGFAP